MKEVSAPPTSPAHIFIGKGTPQGHGVCHVVCHKWLFYEALVVPPPIHLDGSVILHSQQLHLYALPTQSFPLALLIENIGTYFRLFPD